MKYQKVLAVLAIMMAAVVMPQDAVAKDKKVKYLGHQYKGAVDKNKVPAGNGVMFVGELRINGFFDDHSAKNAEVHCFGGSSPDAWFSGTITYDDSDNIVLKAGGTISINYYSDKYDLQDGKAKVSQETLTEDRIVNSNTFGPKSIKLPYTFKPVLGGGFDNSPSFTIDYTLTSQFCEYYSSSYGRRVSAIKFIDLTQKEKEEKLQVVTNYKDEKGRIWNYKSSREYSVKYPDGSIYEKNNSRIMWEIHYPDGKILKYDRGVYDLGNSFHVVDNKSYDCFKKFKELPTINLMGEYSSSSMYSRIYSDYYDFKTLTSQEGDKIIQEKLIPLLGGDPSSCRNDITSASGEKTLGYIKAGKYISAADDDKAWEASKKVKNAKELAEYKKEIKPFVDRYGFDPYSYGKDAIKVGRKLSALYAWNEWNDKKYKETSLNIFRPWKFSLAKDEGASKCYYLVYNGHRNGYMWVSNGVVTSVRWY